MSLAPDADPRFARFGLRTECPACGAHLPVNGPAPAVDCADCGHRTAVPQGLLAQLLDGAEENWPSIKDADAITIGDNTWRYTREAAAAATCAACAQSLPEDWPPEQGRAACPSCDADIQTEPVPDWLRGRVHSAVRLIGGEVDQTRDDQPERPVALQCPSCGAGLSVTHKHQRLTPCERCGSNVHIPDVVWRALHPPRTVQPWFIRFEGESVPARRRRTEAEKAAKKKADAERSRQEREAKERVKKEEAERQAKKNAEVRAAWEKEQAELGRRRLLTSLPLLFVAWGLTVGAVGAMGAAGVWVVIGHGSWLRSIGLNAMSAGFLADFLVIGAALITGFAWLAGVFAATRRAGTAFGEVLPWCAFMLVLTSLPMVGPFFGLLFAWQHLRGKEPTVGSDTTLPTGAAWHLALLHLVLGGFAQVVFMAMTNTGLVVWGR